MSGFKSYVEVFNMKDPSEKKTSQLAIDTSQLAIRCSPLNISAMWIIFIQYSTVINLQT